MAGRPSDEEISKWQRWFGVECSNRAWELAESPDRTPDESQEMLHAAHAAALHWSRVGTPVNAARAHMLLGLAHSLCGEGRLALEYAKASLAYFTSHECPDWEFAFAHAVMASAAQAASDHPLHVLHHREATRLGEAISDEEDREIYMRTFRQVPPP